MSDKKQTVQDEAAIITLEFDDGEVIECEEMGIFDYDGKDYIALIPLDGGYNEVGEDEFELVDIEDDSLFAKVVEEFDTIMDANQE